MYIAKRNNSVKANQTRDRNRNRRVMADTDVDVAPEATELVLEAEDVADLLAEVTGEAVAVDVTDDSLEFTVGDDSYTVAPDEDEEVELMETSRRKLQGKRPVAASTRRPVANGKRRPIRR